MESSDHSEDERDALISAVAAREGFEQNWVDLSTERNHDEQDPSQYWLKPVRYFWPSQPIQKKDAKRVLKVPSAKNNASKRKARFR